jgi:streptogramin lyase
VAGPDGALWFTNSAGNSIGRITTGGTVSNYTGTGISDPYYITTGPDGALWFTNFTNNSIGRITPVGAITVIAVPGASSPGSITAGPVGDPNSLWFVNAGDTTIARMTTGGTVTNKFPTGQLVNRITSGSDGALWFTAPFDNGIGRMDTSGNVNYYPSGLPTVSWADGITAGPDGDLWYTDNDNPGSIGQMDTSGNVIGNYTDPGHLQDLNQIIAGPDGGLWFTTNNGNSSVGRIDPVTHAITYVTDPSLNGVNGFNGLAAGPDGAVWALNTNAHSISRIDPGTETVTAVYTDPLLTTFAFALTAGGDGALWFIDLSRSSIGRMTTDGTVTETPDPNMNNPTYMTQGPDGALYYTNGTNNSVSRADPNGVANAPTAVGGTRGNGQVSLSWTAPANTGALSVTDYSVSVFNSSGGTATGVTGGTTRLVGSATPNLVFSGLTNGTAYTFKVAAVNSAGTGTLSALSAPVTPFTVPGAPTVTSVTPGNGQLALTWNAPVDDGGSAVTDYAVSVFDSVGGPATGVTGPATRLVGSAATSYAFTGLTNGTRYEFAVAAVNAAGTGAQSALTGGNYPSSFSVPAMLPNPGSAGFDSGYRVNNSVTVSSVGQWSPFGGPQNNWGAGGSGFAAPAGSLLPGATGQYALVGRIGTSGAWTLIGYGPVTLNGHGELFLAMNDQIGQFADNSGSLQISLAALDGVTGTTPPVSATLTSGYEAAWSVPIINDSGSPLTSVSATVTASKNGSTPLAFDTSLMLPLCVPGAGSSLVCPVPDVPAHSTYLFNVYVPTTSLVNGDTVTGTVAVTAAGGLSASGNLGTVAIVNCGTSCVVAVAPPGVPIPSSPAPTTPTDPPQQTVTVPASQAGSTPEPVAVTLSTIAPAAEVGSDLKLCPTATGQTQCSGPISSVVADFSKFNDPANPIAVKIVTDWGTTVPAGRMLMEKKTGGDPLFLLACVKNLFTLQYNTPCLKSETVTGTTNKITTDTIFMTGLDVHFARRTATGGTVISPPAAPTALTVNPGALKATLHWRAPTVTNGAGVTSYVVTVLAGGVVKKTIIYPSPLLTETVTALLNGTAYTFKVAAGNVAGTSVASVVSTAIKVGTPSAPTAVTATAGHTAVTLRWTAPAANGTAAVNGYVITPYVAGIAKPAHTYNTTATTETITGLTTNTNYTFKVAAKNAIGTGPQSPPTPAIKPT